MADEACREKIMSQDFWDFIIPSYRRNIGIVLSEKQACIEDAGFGYRILHVDKTVAGNVTIETYGYNGIPNCYALLDIRAMNQSGISALQNYPTLQLPGEGIMI
ncbi:MAG: peptidase, partial [Dorea sp.]